MRRFAALGIVLALLLPATGETQAVVGQPWTCSVDEQDDSTVRCIAAPEPGLRLYITDVVAQSTTSTAGLFNIVQGTATAQGGGADCSTANANMLPATDAGARFAAAANTSAATAYRPSSPVIVPTGRDVCILGDAGNPVTVQLFGYTAP
jgi:hypothetical protein